MPSNYNMWLVWGLVIGKGPSLSRPLVNLLCNLAPPTLAYTGCTPLVLNQLEANREGTQTI